MAVKFHSNGIVIIPVSLKKYVFAVAMQLSSYVAIKYKV